ATTLTLLPLVVSASVLMHCCSLPRSLNSFPTRRSSDLKFMSNIGENMTCALLGVPFKALAESEHARAIKRMGMREVQEVAGKLRSEEHTSELQSRFELVCRLLLETKTTSRARPRTEKRY